MLFRRIIFVLAGLMTLVTAGVLLVDGHLPARVPDDAPPYSPTLLAQALRSVDARGVVDLTQLKAEHAALEHYVASLAAVAPDSTPSQFPSVEARLAYWLNAYHAMVLTELLDARGTEASRWARYVDATPIGGTRLTRFALERSYFSNAGDARVWLALFDGTKGSGVLDGAPFGTETLNAQLDDAARRFVRKHVTIAGAAVTLPEVFRAHHDEFLAALPEKRKNVLQIVWAFLPDACDEGAPGCATRGELDRVCGSAFDKCQVTYQPPDSTLAVKH